MLHILLFLTAQLFTLSFSNSLRPMTPATELTTTTTEPTTSEPSKQEAEFLHNNVLVFLNETHNDPEDMLLRNYLATLMVRSESSKEHVLVPIGAVKKLCLLLKENLNDLINAAKNNDQSDQTIKNWFNLHSFYLVNNSRYCLILPRDIRSREDYDQYNLLDISECTPLCSEELLSQDDSEKSIETILIQIEDIEYQLSLHEKGTLKKESTVLRQLFSKQIRAHNLFASDPQTDQSIYTLELYKLATQPWHFYLMGHGASGYSVAGFDFETGEIWKTLKVLNHLSTGYLIISSCYTGGINKDILIGHYRNPSIDKELEALIDSLTFSYNIILCSPTDALSGTSSLLEIEMIEKIININLERGVTQDNRILEILGESSLLLRKKTQINQLPLINRPYQSNFKPFLPALTKDFSAAVIENVCTITSTTQNKHEAEKTAFSIRKKSAIETDQQIISRELKIEPQISSFAIGEQEKSFFKEINSFGHEEKLQLIFPVVSDQKKSNFTSHEDNSYQWYTQYPFFLSLQTEEAYHYLKNITTEKSGCNITGERGVFLCLRDLFFNANMRKSIKLYFIKSISGTNDIPQNIIDKKVFDENFPQEGAPLILTNVALVNCYSIKNKTHALFGAFSYQESYYSFALTIEDENAPKNWECIQKLPSREIFEEKLIIFENLTCSKIYDWFSGYPLDHPQDKLINEYLYRRKSIFLDFEKSYPLFKDAHLPDDNRAWEKFPELLEKHAEKQKNSSLIAQHQQENQERFAHMINKLEEYQKRPDLDEQQNSHFEENHNSHS